MRKARSSQAGSEFEPRPSHMGPSDVRGLVTNVPLAAKVSGLVCRLQAAGYRE